MQQELHIDECKFIIIKIINQAIHDYLTLFNSSKPLERACYHIASQFLFDDDYSIKYGTSEKTLNELLEILDRDIHWFRKKIINLKNKKIEEYRRQQNNHYVIYEKDK